MTVRPLVLLGLLATALAACDDGSSDETEATTTTQSTTQSTAPTTTSTTTTTVSVTSTTFGGVTTTSIVVDCFFGFDVIFSVTNAETLGALQYDTDYTTVDGSFDGGGGTVNCVRLAGDFAAFNHNDADKRLSSAFVSTAGFTGPVDIALCHLSSCRATLSPDDFVITITDQSKPDFSPASATVAVTRVERDAIPGSTTLDVGTTTTLSATTTTLS